MKPEDGSAGVGAAGVAGAVDAAGTPAAAGAASAAGNADCMDAAVAAGIGAAATEAGAAGTVAATVEGIVSSDAGNHSKTDGPGSIFFLPLEGGAGSAAAEDLDVFFCRGGRSLSSGVTTAQLDEGRFRGSCGSPLAACRRLGSRELDCD